MLPAGRGGEVGARMRELDWTAHPLGPPSGWPCSLRSLVALILEMPTPAIVFWGPDQTQLYNDGYSAIMGPRHPRYLAAPYRECWPDTYPVIYPWMQRVLGAGEVMQVKDQLFTLTRHGFAEEAYFTFTFSPARDDHGAIAGVFQPVVEVTDAVLSARRTETLRLLATHGDAERPPTAAIEAAFAANPQDLPFALVYAGEGSGLQRVASAGLPSLAPAAAAAAARIAAEVFASGTGRRCDELAGMLGDAHVGPWPETVAAAVALPFGRAANGAPLGVALLGLSPRLRFDDRYREFVEAVARQLASTYAGEEARRVEADLLAREQAARREAELQREHLVSLFALAPAPISVLRGPQLRVELANLQTCALVGRDESALLGRPLYEAVPELAGSPFAVHLHRVLERGTTEIGRATPARFTSPGGGVQDVFLDFAFAPLRAAGGEVDGVLAIGFDVTEQVRARDQLDGLRRAAEAANRAKDEFFAVLGHELRNPLAPIVTALELMRLRGVAEVESERRTIERQARHLVRLVDDLLDISRVTRGKVELHRERVEAAEIVARALEIARPLLESRSQEARVETPERGLAVSVDVVRLAQALSNLLNNAAKFSPAGARIEVAATRRGETVEIAIRDPGIGIAPEMLPRVFDAFVQERQPLDRSTGGLGLGLAIARGIVELHGGTVEATSDGHGRGSTFTVRLPAAASEPARLSDAGGQPASTPAAAPGRRVLVVDDNPDVAESLATWLRLQGHAVRVAHEGESALRLAGEQAPEVALLDIGLPGMDGYELARRLHALPGLARLPLVALTGYGRDSDRERATSAGFAAHLVKPVDLARLEALVRALAATGAG